MRTAFIWILAATEEAATEGGEHAAKGGADLIVPHIEELIWGSVAFLLFLLVVYKLIWPKIQEALEGREQKIRDDLEGAESAKAEAEQILDEYRAKLADARDESNKILEEARKTAESLRRDLLAKAEEEAGLIVDRAKDEVEAEKRQAIGDLYREAGKVSIELAEKVVGRSLDRDAQMALVDQYITDLEAMSSSGG